MKVIQESLYELGKRVDALQAVVDKARQPTYDLFRTMFPPSKDTLTCSYPGCENRAAMYPSCIMEIDKSIHKREGNQLKNGWLMHGVCESCVIDIRYDRDYMPFPDLKFYRDPYATRMCIFCKGTDIPFATNESEIHVCIGCANLVAFKGGAGGDNRYKLMSAVNHRFPWIRMTDALTWKQYASVVKPDKQPARYTPDTFMICDVHGRRIIIILEEDGSGSHGGTHPERELARLIELMTSVVLNNGDRVFVIRYDPTSKSKNVCGNTYNPPKIFRILIVRSWITWFISTIIAAAETGSKLFHPRFTVLYLFYDHRQNNVNKHFAAALARFQKDVNWNVGLSQTFPQDEVVPGGIDWQYCIDPLEGEAFKALAKCHTYGAYAMKARDAF